MLRAAAVAVSIFAIFAAAHAQDTAHPWSDIARADLKAIHQLLLDNHPGPVDPKNPGYRIWFEKGYRESLDRAAARTISMITSARSLPISNGFRDEHTNIAATIDAVYSEWPGFLPAVTEDGKIRATVSEDKSVAVGDEIVACDGVPIDALFERNVAPLLFQSRYPARSQPQYAAHIDDRCRRRSDARDILRYPKCGRHENRQLQWRRVARARAIELRAVADDRTRPELGLRKVDDIWFLSLPGFDYQSAADVARSRWCSPMSRRTRKNSRRPTRW